MNPNLELPFWLYKSKILTAYVFSKPHAVYIPSRDEILQQLGISKEQDEQMQKKYK